MIAERDKKSVVNDLQTGTGLDRAAGASPDYPIMPSRSASQPMS
jgi:hypothetical protein